VGLRDARQVGRSIPREKLRQVNQELPGLLIGEPNAKPIGGRDEELAQDTLLFHVEHLRQTAKEVKALKNLFRKKRSRVEGK